jgi:hypothetical protein
VELELAELEQPTIPEELKPLTEKEQEELAKILTELSDEEYLKMLERLTMLLRSLEGKAPDPSDAITKLINMKNRMERSRFPTYPILQMQVYLRLLGKYNPQAKACILWANMLCSALIAYKGLNWDAYVEMVKATVTPAEEQTFYMGSAKPEAEAKKPGRFSRLFHRQPSQEKSEFKSQ